MSGGQDYVNQRISENVDKLEALSKSLLLDRINVNNEAEKYLSLGEDDLDKLTAVELAHGEYLLSAYSLCIQRKINRANAIKNWANKSIERIIAKNYNAYDKMMKYEIRKAMIAVNDDFAKRLYGVVAEQDLILDELTYLSQSVNAISNSLGNLARIRSKNHAYGSRDA